MKTDKKIEKKIEKILDSLIVEANGDGKKQTEELSNLLTKIQKEVIKRIKGMAFDKEASDITQEYQSTFLDGYNQAIEEVVEYLQSLDGGNGK